MRPPRNSFNLWLKLTFILASTTTLSGCFQPVYYKDQNKESQISNSLSQVSIAKIDGYLGYNLKSELDFAFNGGKDPTQNGRYLLSVSTRESKASSIVDASTGRTQSVTLQAEALYTLIDQQNQNKVKITGKTTASAAYDRSQLRFGAVRAERDAEEKIAKTLAERLKLLVVSAITQEVKVKKKASFTERHQEEQDDNDDSN